MSDNVEAFRGQLRGTVTGIPAPMGADGGQRLLISISTDSPDWADWRRAHSSAGNGSPARMTCIVNWPPGGTPPFSGDDVYFHASVRNHPRKADFLVADMIPTPDPRTRLEAVLRSSAISVSASVPTAQAFPGLSVLAAGSPKVIRRTDDVTDPYVARAYKSLLDDERLQSQVVMFVQPGALPASSLIDETRGMMQRMLRGMGLDLTKSSLTFKPDERTPGNDFDRAAPAGFAAVGFMSRNTSNDPAEARAYVGSDVNPRDSFALVMPYSPEMTPAASWSGLSGLSAAWAPKEVNSTGALADLTARHETAHAAASPFARTFNDAKKKSQISAGHREECYADAAAILSYLQDGGDPQQTRIFARARHLSALNPTVYHCTGMACDAAIEEGLRLRDFVVRGGAKASPYALVNKAVKIADIKAHPSIAHHNVTMFDVLKKLPANAERGDVLAAALASVNQMTNPAARQASLEMIRGAGRALDGVWTPYELLDGKNARAAAQIREASLKDNLEFLSRMHMPHLERRTRNTHNRAFRLPFGTSLLGALRQQTAISILAANQLFSKDRIPSFENGRAVSGPSPMRQWLASRSWSFMVPFVRRDPESVQLAAMARVWDVTSAVPSAPPAEMLRPAPYVMGGRPPPGWWSGLATDPELGNMSVHGLLDRCVLRLREASEYVQNSDITKAGEAWKGFSAAANMLLMDPAFCDAGDAYVGRVSMDSLIALSDGPVLDERTPAADRDGLASKATRLSGAMSVFLDDHLLVAVARHEIWAAALSLPEAERMDMTHADFRGRDLSGRCLDGARLVNPNFSGTILRGFTMRYAEVSEAEFWNAQMFTNTDLRGTNPDGMNLNSVRGGPPMTDARSEPSDDHELSADFAQNSGQNNSLPSASRRF